MLTRVLRRTLALLLVALATQPAHPGVPGGPATFQPAGPFTNGWAPFQPGAVKVSVGREGGNATMEIETHRPEPRLFLLGEDLVECAVIEEQEFVAGALVDASVNYLGEDTDGNVWYFGEISTTFEDGVAVSTEGSWLVGGATLPGDPEDALAVPAPFLFMPADPQPGDTWTAEDLPGDGETMTILAADAKVKTALGTFQGGLKLREVSLSDDESETKWLVPGLGIVKSKGSGEQLRMRATSLLPMTD